MWIGQFKQVWGVWPVAIAVVLTMGGCHHPPNALLRKQGIDAYQQKDTATADDRFGQAVGQDPTDWKSLYYLGLIRLDQDRPRDAQLLLEQALELRYKHQETDDILDALAQALWLRQAHQPLVGLLERAIRDRGTSRDYIRQGRYLMMMGDRDAARLAYEKAAYFAADGESKPYVTLADFYETIGDTDRAVTALRQAHGIAPKDTHLSNRLRRYGIVPGPTAALEPLQPQRPTR